MPACLRNLRFGPVPKLRSRAIALRLAQDCSAQEPVLRSGIVIAALVSALLLAGAAAIVLPGRIGGADPGGVYGAPGLEPMSFEQARGAFYTLTPALLLVVYEAFGRTQEADIYDTLASVADGAALEQLYLERVGAMRGGGLEEADQTIHEIKLLTSSVSGTAGRMVIDASWQVIGTVGHAEHLHVRGNTYRADLTVAPIGDAWKITRFALLDVSRDDAGETFAAPPEG